MRLLFVTGVLCLALCQQSAVASSIWEEPEQNKYTRTMERANAKVIQASQRHDYGQGLSLREMVLSAVIEYENAVALRPHEAEPHYRAAETLNSFFIFNVGTPEKALVKRTLAHWAAFEKLAPNDSRLASILFRRSLAYTKLGGEENFKLAIADYEHLLHIRADGLVDSATVLGNTAELHMAAGNLARSIELYKEALRYSSSHLHYYGLAMALLRDEQISKAKEIMEEAAKTDKLRSLRNDSVFFVPEGEIHAYLAFGYEVLGRVKEAKEHNQIFLQRLPNSRYAGTAREQQRRLGKLRSEKPKKRSRKRSRKRKGKKR